MTTEQPNGIRLLKIRATDKHGNHTDAEYRVEIDNLLPVITMRNEVPRWTNGSKPLRVSAAFNKPMVAFAVSSPHGANIEKQGSFTAIDEQYSISCPASTTVTLAATDVLGRVDYKQFDVNCDNIAPTLNMRSSLFRSERGGLNPTYTASPDIHLEWGTRPEYPVTDIASVNFPLTESVASFPVFEKYFNRLDYLPNAGLDEIVQNLPMFQLFARDNETPEGQIHVEYRYLFNGALKRDWASLAASSGTYKVPFSYQTMLPLDLLVDPVRARRENFIARSRHDDVHTVELRATDLAGNSTVKTFNFRLDLMSPPVTLRYCRLTESTTNLSMAFLNIHDAYNK